MPAPPSSRIDPAVGHLVELASLVTGEQPGLLGVLAQVADPRHSRRVRHRLAGILGLALCAVVAGARSFTAIAEWAADADERTLRVLGITGTVPSESTLRRTLQRLDAGAFDGPWPAPGHRGEELCQGRDSGVSSRWTARTFTRLGRRRGIPVIICWLPSIMVMVPSLGQVGVGAKTNEIPMFPVLLDRIDITGAVITADAMHAQRGHAAYLAGRGAHFLLASQGNQPGLHTQLAALPWRQVPVARSTPAERGHGRD